MCKATSLSLLFVTMALSPIQLNVPVRINGKFYFRSFHRKSIYQTNKQTNTKRHQINVNRIFSNPQLTFQLECSIFLTFLSLSHTFSRSSNTGILQMDFTLCIEGHVCVFVNQLPDIFPSPGAPIAQQHIHSTSFTVL